MPQPSEGETLPEIARFFGRVTARAIIIRRCTAPLFVEPGAPHHRPHFADALHRAYYRNHIAVFGIDTIEVHTLVWPNGADFDQPPCTTGRSI